MATLFLIIQSNDSSKYNALRLQFQLKDILDSRLEELRKKLTDVKEELESDKKLVSIEFERTMISRID